MMQTKHQFYHSGVDNQTRADITVDLKRPDRKKIENWTPAQKRSMKKWILRCEDQFKIFKEEILSMS